MPEYSKKLREVTEYNIGYLIVTNNIKSIVQYPNMQSNICAILKYSECHFDLFEYKYITYFSDYQKYRKYFS